MRYKEEESRSIDNFDEYSSIFPCFPIRFSLVAIINYAITLDYIDGSRGILNGLDERDKQRLSFPQRIHPSYRRISRRSLAACRDVTIREMIS